MQLEESFHVTDRTKLRQWLPWMHLFRSFRIAIGIRPVVLGIAAALLIDFGGQFISQLPFAVDAAPPSSWTQPLSILRPEVYAVHPALIPAQPVNALRETTSHGSEILQPLWSVVGPGQALFHGKHSWSHSATIWTHLLWGMIVWGIFGVAIARMTAVRFAVDQSVRTRESLRFAMEKLPASLGAPLMPLLGVGCLWLICLVGGLLGRIPSVGPILVGAFWWLPLLLAGLMTLLLLGLAVGWPLMLSSIGTEDADSFDSFSRAYSYLFSRPWYALWLMFLALLYGSVLLTFVATIIQILMPLAEWSVASGLGGEQTFELLRGSDDVNGFASSAVDFWQNVIRLGLVGFVTSYFWTATTVIYFLLRKSVDATPLDAVAQRVTSKPNALPIMGVAAAEQREKDTESPSSEDESALTE